MNKSRFLTLTLGTFLMCPLTMLTAQSEFYKFDFTAAEGFVDGGVFDFDPEGNNWAVWPNDPPNSTFSFDTSGTGNLVIDPSEAGFQLVKYVGFGFELVDNAYYGEIKLTLNYEVGAAARIEGATDLPALVFRGLNDPSKNVLFGLRQTSAGPNTFNFFNNSGPVGGWAGAFADTIPGEELGLAVDEGGLWTDGMSDEILIRFSLVNTQADMWVMTSSVYNLTTGKHFQTITLDVTDGDGTFTSQPHFFEMQDDNMDRINGAVHVDYFSINFAPLPDVELTTLWAGYEVAELGWVDTGTWMGYLNVASGDWVWSASLATYIYLPEDFVSESGAWTYIPGN